jgi:protein-tyrosine-phosphatase
MKNILVLCTGNSARSILGEAILNRLGQGRIRAFSAGSQPTGRPNPFAIALLHAKGYDTGFARSKSWDEFAAADAPKLDIVITVCDSAAAETCPYWPGAPVSAHWGLPDPAAATGTNAEIAAAFEATYASLFARAEAFIALPERLPAAEMKAALSQIGKMA